MKPRAIGMCGLALALCALPLAASAKCNLKRAAEFPVTDSGDRPGIDARINGQEAHFILESGAFYSMMSSTAAAQFDLRPYPVPGDFVVDDPSGRASRLRVHVNHLVLHDAPISHVEFLVGGSEPGYAGVIGQNMLQSFDTEFDLGHGVVRLFESDGCEKSRLAYWVQPGESFSRLVTAQTDTWHPQVIASAQVARQTVRVMFDSGSPVSLLSLRAASGAGVNPGMPGVTDLGSVPGRGGVPVHSYLATFPSFRLGDEEIKGARLRIADLGALNADMLLGADFFRSHRIFVGTREGQVYLTYNGGAVFAPVPERPAL